MAAWRDEISLLVFKNISLVRCLHSLEEKFCISARPCKSLLILKQTTSTNKRNKCPVTTRLP